MLIGEKIVQPSLRLIISAVVIPMAELQRQCYSCHLCTQLALAVVKLAEDSAL